MKMNIIIVALGIIPEYLDDCINQINLTQKKHTIHLIKNRSSNYTNDNCLIANVENIPISKKHSYFIKKSKLVNKKFRNYFWRYSTERLYVIDDYINAKNLNDIIHIETDVLLYQDLELIMPILKEFDFACVRDSAIRVIGSIIYIKNKKVSEKISSIANDYINENDMIILHQIEKKIDNTLCLPIGDHDIYKDNLKYIFDGASIGQFVGGIDPRNKSGKIMSFINNIKAFFNERNAVSFVNKNSKINVSEWEIKWINSRPYKKINNDLIPIVNLHIHSKNLKKFMQ